MTKAELFRHRIEFSTIRAERAPSEDVRNTWLQIRESYRHLLQLETSLLLSEQAFGFVELASHAQKRARY